MTGGGGNGGEPLFLVLPNGVRYPVGDAMTIGRGDDVTVKIDDRTVSRLHARIADGPGGPTIEDAGSSFGTLVGGQSLSAPHALVPGLEIRLGNVVLHVESAAPRPPARVAGDAKDGPGPAPEPASANSTLVVPINATALGLRAAAPQKNDGAMRPRLRSGFALKRIEPDGDVQRYILRDLRSGQFLALEEIDAKLIELFDGQMTVGELLVAATRSVGVAGAGRLARLVADLGERGLLDGVAPTPVEHAEPNLLQRAFKSREKVLDWVPGYFERAYQRWGRIYFSSLAVFLLVLLSIAGLVVFSYLIGARYGTPLVVAHKLLLGGLVFIGGRFAIVAVHELAHGLALAHYGRSTSRAGIRLLFIFPYAFVDSSEAYFESRLHRIVISAAGPLSDFSLGALFSIICAVLPKGSGRDILFQLAFAGYIGAFFNANPFLDRDGYQILVEWSREPGLKQRARAQLKQRLTGKMAAEQTSPVLARYAIAGLVWSAVGAGFVAIMSLRYQSKLAALAPHWLVTAGFVLFFIVLLLPIPIALGAPLLQRWRFGTPEVNRLVR